MTGESRSCRRRRALHSACLLVLSLALSGCPATPEKPTSTVVKRRSEMTKLRDAGRYDEAVTLGRQILADAERESGPESGEAGQVMGDVANALREAGRAAEALPLAERSLAIERTLSDKEGLGDSLLSLGTVQWTLGDYPAARKSLAESIEVYTDAVGPDDLIVASAIENMGILLWTTGEYPAALERLEETMRIRQARLEPGDNRIARTLNNLAILHSEMGNYALARTMYERSLAIRERVVGRDHPETADVLDNLAMVLQDQGEAREARALYEQALDIRERLLGPEHPAVAVSLVGIGDVLREAGELEGALAAMQRAVAINRKTYGEKHRRVATSLEGVANVLLAMGRYDEARVSAEEALAVRLEVAPGDVRVATALGLLSEAHAGQGDLRGALGLKQRAVEVTEAALDREHPSVASQLVGLASLQVRTGDSQAAGRNLERALAIRETQLGPEHPDVALALGPLALLRWQQGDPGGARTAARRAGEIQDAALRSTLQDLPEEHALYLASGSVEPEVVLFSGLLRAGDGAADWIAPCWDWTLRRRGLVFDELARRQRVALLSGSPESLAAWGRLSDARRRLAALWIRGPGEGDPKKHRTLLAEATREKKSAETDLARATLGHTSDTPAGRGEVARALPTGGVLVEVIRVDISPPRSRERTRQDVALILSGDGRMGFVPLGPSSRIDRLVESWRRALDADLHRIAAGAEAADPLEASRRTGIALRRAVWDPIAAKIGAASPLFLVPDGALHRVDLRALPLDDGRYLAETGRRVHLLSTGRDLDRLAGGGQPAPPVGSGLLALGAPDFAAPAGARLLVAGLYRSDLSECLAAADRRWPPLPESAAEVRDIAAQAPQGMPVQVVTGAAASEELFRRAAKGHGFLHVATHGYFAPERCAYPAAGHARDEVGTGSSGIGIGGANPLLLSGLILAGAGRGGDPHADDGVLTAEEIAGLDLTGVRLAVLSACDTGAGTIAVGEGVFGLRRSLEIAGARTVVMSLWRVSDREARRWMKSFYAALFAGASAAEADQTATLDSLRGLRDRGRPAHPYLWAGFVTAGDWR